jgi:hypothetical protein
MRDTRRITLVVRKPGTPSRAWDTSPNATNRILFVKALSMLSFVFDHRSEDIDRLLIDEACMADEFLDLLASLRGDFLGDVVLINSRKNSYLSTACRADGRLLYAMTPNDLQFYFAAHRLVENEAKAA